MFCSEERTEGWMERERGQLSDSGQSEREKGEGETDIRTERDRDREGADRQTAGEIERADRQTGRH